MRRNLLIVLILIMTTIILKEYQIDYSKCERVQATVVDKTYVPKRINNLNEMKVIKPEQHMVTLCYGNVKKIVNDKKLYENFNVNDKVHVNLYSSKKNKQRKIVFEE